MDPNIPPPIQPNLPVEPITSSEELEREIESVGSSIKDLTADWNLRRVTLIEFQHMIKNRNAPSFDSFAALVGKHIIAGICVQLEDRRSSLTKEVCTTITTLAETLKGQFEEFASTVLASLFKLLIVTIKPISEPSHQCIVSILKYCSKCVPVIANGLADAHPVLRSRCSESYISLVLQNNNPKDIEEYAEVFENAIKKSITDANANARTFGRSSYIAFKNLWADRADKLYSEVDPSSQKILAESKPSVSTAKPSMKDFIKQAKKVDAAPVSNMKVVDAENIQPMPVVQTAPPKQIEVPKVTPIVEVVALPQQPSVSYMSATESSMAKKRIVDKTNVVSVAKSPKINKKSSPKSTRSTPRTEETETGETKEPKKRNGSKWDYLLNYEKGNTPIAMRVRTRAVASKSKGTDTEDGARTKSTRRQLRL